MIVHTRKGLSRRTLLRGILAGGVVSVALPALEIFTGSGKSAFAAGEGFPKRFGMFFWGNGVQPERWIPAKTGDDFELSDELMPLSALMGEFTVVSGLEVKVQNLKPHGSGPGGLLSGTDLKIEGDDDTFRLPSLDQRIAAAVGGATLYRSVEAAVQPGASGRSYTGPGSRNPPVSDPIKLYERLFGGSFAAPGEEQVIDPKLALRRSVLSAVRSDAQRLESRLGTSDKQRLEQHMDAVRDLENRLLKLEQEPPSFLGCARPVEPGALPAIEGRPQMRARNDAMSRMMAMAFACDLTRVGSLWYSDPVNNVLYEDKSAGHHQLTHDEPGDQPQVHEIVVGIMEDFAVYLEALRSVPEGEGTLLDNCAVLATTDVSYGRTHQIDEYPIIVAGSAGGALKMGHHIRSESKENASRIPLTLMQAVGVNATEFGEGNARVEAGLSEIEV
ncbi:MAG: hypothetical protein ACI9OJ_001193 [Myxococcota bacterium]|jgi:hypothetical protein